MRILITGIHGFVGNNLVEALSAEHQIYGLDIQSPEKAGVIKTFGWNQLGELPEVDAVIHLAGKAHDTRNQTDADLYFRVNRDLTCRIYDWFLDATADKFIFFSSVKAAAETVRGNELTEDVVPAPAGPYGESKLAAENYIRSKDVTASERGKKTYILRPAMIHGPGNKGNLNLLYKLISKRFPWPLGAFKNKRSFTSIKNVIFVLEKILISEKSGGVFNIADDEPLSTNELIKLISETTGRPCLIWKINQKLIVGTARAGSVLRLPLNTETLRKLTENYVVSNRKIRDYLGIDELPVGVREGIISTIKNF
jgi:nucleoside-diphosphate-sugar epimerase